MTIEQIGKIRKMLDSEKYHLNCKLREVTPQDLLIVKEWYLFCNGKLTMSSETNTYKQLLKFATEHRTYNISERLCKLRVYVSFYILFLVMLNVTLIHSEYLSGITTGINLFIIFESLIYMKLDTQNFKVKMKEYEERCTK